MAKYQVDRNSEFMKENWGTTKLVTDYGAMTPTKKRRKTNLPRIECLDLVVVRVVLMIMSRDGIENVL